MHQFKSINIYKLFLILSLIIVALFLLKASPEINLKIKTLFGSRTQNRPLSSYKIAFTHRDGENLKLYVINADGANRKLIYSHSDPVNSNILSPAWKNSNKLLFVAMQNGEWSTFSINDDGSKLHYEGPGFAAKESYSFEQFDNGLSIDYGNIKNETLTTSTLYYMKDANKIKIFTTDIAGNCDPKHGLCSPYFAISAAIFSPDKKYIAIREDYCSEPEPCIVIAKADGSENFFLTSGMDFAWSP